MHKLHAAEAEVARLAAENAELTTATAAMAARLRDVEAFLADYGLTFIGDAALAPPLPAPGDVAPPVARQEDIDFPLVIFRLRQLSAAAGEGRAKVERGSDGVTRLVHRTSLRVVVHRDGVSLGGGGDAGASFIPFRSVDGRDFLGDVLEGYFPESMRAAHPEGCVLEVVDRSAADHRDGAGDGAITSAAPLAQGDASDSRFPGEGRRLGDVASNGPAATTTGAATAGRQGPLRETVPRLTAEQLLARLPQRLVAEGGQVVPVREAVQQMLRSARARAGADASTSGRVG
jgi:hypothetical protein